MTYQHVLGIVPLTLGSASHWLEVYLSTLGILTSSLGNLPRKVDSVTPGLWYIYYFICNLPRPYWDIYHGMGWPTNISWALYPLHWAAYPNDWKSTQIPWAHLPLQGIPLTISTSMSGTLIVGNGRGIPGGVPLMISKYVLLITDTQIN
jgi:hypothetical protein